MMPSFWAGVLLDSLDRLWREFYGYGIVLCSGEIFSALISIDCEQPDFYQNSHFQNSSIDYIIGALYNLVTLVYT